MAILGNKRGSKRVTDNHVYMRFDWEIISQDFDTGITEVSWSVSAGLEDSVTVASDTFLGLGVTIKNYIKTNDFVTSINVNAGGTDTFGLNKGEEKIIHSGVHKITNELFDGTNATMQVSFSIHYSQATIFSSGNQLFYVRGMSPYSFHMDAPDFNDAQNLTISYITPFALEGYLKMNLYINGWLIRSDNITSLTKGLHAYTFVFTDEDREKFYNAMEGATTTSYSLYIESWTYGNTYAVHQDVATGVFKLTDSAPILNPTVRDANAVTAVLTGDDTVLVKYWSNAEITIGAEAVKGANLTEYGVTNGAFTYLNQDPLVLENIESNVFVFHAKDDKGQSSKQTITTGFVDYIKLTSKVVANAPSGEGDMNVQVTGNYFNGSFGATANELFVYFRYKEQSADEFSDWIAFTDVVIDETTGNYTASAYLEGLDYQATYIFQSQATDALDSVQSAEYVVVTIPIFDWGKNDFNFNVPVTIQGKRIGGANEILWQGSDVMLANAAVELSGAISAQMHGIVLVFSNQSGDVSWNTFYVPKEMVNVYNGGGHTFVMAVNAGFSSFGAKYLYISDTSITGHTTNGEEGVGASNILFNNADYVLRYVFGV